MCWGVEIMENDRKLIQFHFITNAEVSTHYHQNPEVFYVLTGELKVQIDETTFLMKQGDIILINANKRHTMNGNEELLGARFEIDFHLLAEYMESMQLLFWCNSVADKNAAYADLREVFDHILSRYFEKDEKSALDLQALYFQAAHILTSNFLVKADDTRLNMDDSQDRQRVRRIQNYIQANYPEFEIVKCTTTEECMELLNSGECDFMAQNVNVVTPLLQKPRYEGLTVLPNLSKEEPMGIVGKNSDENKILMSIINKCITQIPSQEVSQITISHTVENGYQLTWTDVLYKFRYPLIVIFILLVASILFMIFWQEARRKSYLKIAEKNEQLLEAVDQANRANQAKSDFLARMSHEIRTPMNAIVGLTEIAKHYEEDPKKIEDYLDKIDVSSKVLLNIINDILDMSSIENKKMKIAKEPFDLHEILMSVCTIYEPQCKQKGIAFEVQDEEVTHTHLIGDGLRVNQILLNLVSNAYKFTPSGGKITIKVKELYVKEEKAYFNFLVEDTGEGMSEEMQTRLFQPFEQESATTAQKHGGSGLGLSIAKNFVELMSGSISVKSKKGEGTTFVVSIPFEFEQAAEPEITEQPVENDLSVVQEEQAVYDFTGKKVLLAEDTAFNEEVATELLAMVHMDVDCAHNGKEAVELFEKAKPGTYMAILMDIHMPVMNGYEAARTIRKSEREDAGTIAIYAMTANSFEEDVSAALNAGMNGHIAKPIDAQILYEVLDKLAKEQQ